MYLVGISYQWQLQDLRGKSTNHESKSTYQPKYWIRKKVILRLYIDSVWKIFLRAE